MLSIIQLMYVTISSLWNKTGGCTIKNVYIFILVDSNIKNYTKKETKIIPLKARQEIGK